MRRVATDAALGLDRHMLVDERTLLVDVALVTDGVAVGHGPELAGDRRPMRVMAVAALQQALVYPVVIGFGEVRFSRSMAAVAQLRRALDQQVRLFFGVMRRVTVYAADVAAGVG